MDNQNFSDFKEKNKKLISSFLIILEIFLIVLIILNSVNIFNKIKEGKYIGQEIETKNTITVSGKGEIYVKPDISLTTFSVITEAKTVNEALQNNTKKMNSVISFLKEQGIEDKDLKTINFNISPRYEWYEKSDIYPEGKRVLVGYEVSQSLQVKIRDMEKIGTIIEGATKAGANNVGDLQFAIDDQKELIKQAREQAIIEAKKEAQAIASSLGVSLKRIVGFNENNIMPQMYTKNFYQEASLAVPSALQIQTGENKIEMTVNITYEIK